MIELIKEIIRDYIIYPSCSRDLFNYLVFPFIIESQQIKLFKNPARIVKKEKQLINKIEKLKIDLNLK